MAGVQAAAGQDGFQQLNSQTVDCAESPTDGVFTWGRIYFKESDNADKNRKASAWELCSLLTQALGTVV